MTTRSTSSTTKRRTSSRKQSPKMSFKQLVIFLIVFLIVAFVYNWYMERQGNATTEPINTEETTATTTEPTTSDDTAKKTTKKSTTKKNTKTTKSSGSIVVNMPSEVGDNQIVKHKYFTLSYNNTHEQADWVFYLLTKAMMEDKSGRTNDFRADPDVKLVSAYSEDYTGTGYDRGHLCPSADVRLDEEGQSETFYMSNMSPQAQAFNRGIWKKLEEQVRKWASNHDSIYIATGPVLRKGLKKIGKTTKISVPDKYYKILYTPNDGGHMIGFMLPNNACSGHTFKDYQVSIDEIEEATGIDFFPKVSNEELLESEKGSLKWWN